MSDDTKKTLCASCSSAIWCDTWAQYKCTVKERHITGPKTVCASYTKRPAKWKEMPCRCADCLTNDLLAEEQEEE